MMTHQKNIIIFEIRSASIQKKEFDSEPVIDKNVLKTKIKSHGKKVTDFHDKEILKVDSNHTYLAVISFYSALKKYENY